MARGSAARPPPDAVEDASLPLFAGETTVRPPPAFDESFARPPSLGASDGGAGEAFVRGASVGRYVLLDRIGAGGMGQVFAAYDPELDRKVAVKLVLAGGYDSEIRLLREAQGLARLTHSNVVTIHDVGIHTDIVWIAMEFVAGQTLGAWARAAPRSWRTLLGVLLSAARGVAAAHAAGLVHRDLKPDNIMVGDDDRVRVMDFGLVHGHTPAHAGTLLTGPAEPAPGTREPLPGAAITRMGAVLGTPAYMAPEQWRGEDAGVAADQFGWSVMAWELLHGERPFTGDSPEALRDAILAGRRRSPPRGRPVPAWLRRVVERGLAGDPRQRWPDMNALVTALERGQSLIRRRFAVATLVLITALVGLAFGLQRWRVAQRLGACEAAGAELGTVWNDDARQRLRDAFAATGLSYAANTADRILPRLDERLTAWRAARIEVCMNVEARGLWGAALQARAVSCLEDRQIRFEALVTELAQATATTVRKAVSAVAGMSPVEACLDEDMLRRQPIPPAQGGDEIRAVQTLISQAESLAMAGDAKAGLTLVVRARERAELLAWPPLLAAAQAAEGELLRQTGAFPESEAVSAAAYFTASGAGAWDVAAKAANLLILSVGVDQERHAEGRLWASLAETALVHAGDPSGLREASRLGNLALLKRNAGLRADAKVLFQRALALREAALVPDHPDIALSLSNLAMAEHETGAPEAAKALLVRALAIQEQVLGPDHPDVALVLSNLGAELHNAGDLAEAKPLLARALAIQEQVDGPNHPGVARTLNNLGAVYADSGELAAALLLYERSLAIREQVLGPDHSDVAKVLGNLADADFQLGDYAAARARSLRALAIHEKNLGPGHPDVAQTLIHLADGSMAEGDYAAARPPYQRAVAILEKALGPDHPDVAVALGRLAVAELEDGQAKVAVPLLERAATLYTAHAGLQQRELEARFDLARALVRTGGDRDRALALARSARDDMREAGAGKEKDLAGVEQWLAEHDRPARGSGRVGPT